MHISKHIIGAVLIICLALLVVLLLGGGGRDDQYCLSLAPFLEEGCNDGIEKEALLDVLEFKSYIIGTLACGEGVVKNISKERLGYVRSILTFYEKDGNVFDFSEGYINSEGKMFLPGEEALFKRCIEDDMSKADTDRTKAAFIGKVGDDFDDRNLYFGEQ